MEIKELSTIAIEILGLCLMCYCFYAVFAKPKKISSPIGTKTLVMAIVFLIITIIFIKIPMAFYLRCGIGAAILLSMFFFMRKVRKG